jgi:Fe-S cluster assembly iron-binding protein IscA
MALMVTERAAEALHDTLENIDRDPEQVLRLVPQSDGLGLALDEKRDDDDVVEYQGEAVMVMDRSIGDQLTGVTLDFADGPEGGRLTLKGEDDTRNGSS